MRSSKLALILLLAAASSRPALAWAYCVPVTFHSSEIPSDQTGFLNMVCVNLTTGACDSGAHANFVLPQMKTVGNGGSVTNANGYDAVFHDDAACTVPMTDFRLVPGTYDGTTGAAQFYVKLDRSSSVDDIRYIGIGDAGITTDQGSTSVCDADFVSVWPLPNGSTLTANDLCPNAYDGTLRGTRTPTATNGQIDGAAALLGDTVGDNPDINFGTTTSPNLEVTTFTVEQWINSACPASFTFGAARLAFSKFSASHGYETSIGQVSGTCRAGFFAHGLTAGPEGGWWPSAGTFTASTWVYLVQVYTTGTGPLLVYINGVLTDTLAGVTGTISYASADAKGGLGSNTFGNNAVENVDEVRVSRIVRSADWIAATFNNLSSPATFYTIGTPVPMGSTCAAGSLSSNAALGSCAIRQ